jgi:hypothetical protein
LFPDELPGFSVAADDIAQRLPRTVPPSAPVRRHGGCIEADIERKPCRRTPHHPFKLGIQGGYQLWALRPKILGFGWIRGEVVELSLRAPDVAWGTDRITESA